MLRGSLGYLTPSSPAKARSGIALSEVMVYKLKAFLSSTFFAAASIAVLSTVCNGILSTTDSTGTVTAGLVCIGVFFSATSTG